MKMDSIKYQYLVRYLKDGCYPHEFKKQDKAVLRRLSKSYFYDREKSALFYVDINNIDKTKFHRLVIQDHEKQRVFEECHSANFAGHVGRDNTLKKIKERYYWPDYYKDTLEMVNIK